MAIYPYSDTFRSLLYQYKGCGDIELSGCFLERVRLLLKIRYAGYLVTFAPSHFSHVAARGFDHVPTVFESLGKPILDLFAKTTDMKQSSQSKGRRRQVGKYIVFKKKPSLVGKKILFVDDVYTTGSTTRACLKLLQGLHPKKVAVLVLAKVSKRG